MGIEEWIENYCEDKDYDEMVRISKGGVQDLLDKYRLEYEKDDGIVEALTCTAMRYARNVLIDTLMQLHNKAKEVNNNG